MNASSQHVLHSFSEYFSSAVKSQKLDRKTASQALENLETILNGLDG